MSPLSGKLPEWPASNVVNRQWHVVAYWESRARLAVKALETLDKELRAAWDERTLSAAVLDVKTVQLYTSALKAIGPLPQEYP